MDNKKHMAVFSIIKKSELEGAKRLDAEYYQPEYLDITSKLKNARAIKTLASDIRYGLYVEPDYLDEGINFIRAMNTTNFWVDGEVLKISNKKVPSDYFLHAGDCLIVRSGANTGLVSVIYPRLEGSTFGSYTIRIRFDKVNPFFASVFLNTRYGFLQTLRSQTGAAQPNLNIPNIKEIKIPVISEHQQKDIEKRCIEIERARIQSEILYSQAENLLLEELGLKDFTEEQSLYTAVNFSELKESCRMDAEYFQLKYRKIYSLIRENKGITLGEIATLKKGFEPGSEAYQEDGKLFIRVSSVSKDGITEKDQKYLKNDLYQKLKKNYQPKVGEILLTKDASPGIAYAVKESIEGVISGGVLRVKINEDVESEYLTLCINSKIGQSQVERDAGGSIIKHWKPEQVKSMLIPILPKPTQQEIAKLVRKSHEARKKAKELLEEAKRAVETLIERQQ